MSPGPSTFAIVGEPVRFRDLAVGEYFCYGYDCVVAENLLLYKKTDEQGAAFVCKDWSCLKPDPSGCFNLFYIWRVKLNRQPQI
jgi:hypothetical protein